MNRDTLVATFLLVFCGGAFALSFAIPETTYSSISAAAWPRFVIVIVTLLSLIYLGESLRDQEAPRLGAGGGVSAFMHKYATAIACYVIFALFVLAVPYLGMLVAGVLFVFAMLSAVGERSLRHHLMHLAISVGTVAGLWVIFTYGLNVMLPAGRLFRYW